MSSKKQNSAISPNIYDISITSIQDRTPTKHLQTLNTNSSSFYISDILVRWILASFASTFCEFITYPLDFVTTRLQLQNELKKSTINTPSIGMIKLLHEAVRNEGMYAPFAGVSVAIARQVFNAGISVGLYPAVRNILFSDMNQVSTWTTTTTTTTTVPLLKRALAGAITGSLGQLLANPFDVVKVRLQADKKVIVKGLKPTYMGPFHAITHMYQHEGIKVFYTALSSSVYRAAIINAVGIATYDQTKEDVFLYLTQQQHWLNTNAILPSQIIGALVCGIATALVSTPLNIVKTRLMANPYAYKGPNDALIQLLKVEGISGAFKGFFPTYQRQAIWNFTFWMVYEQILAATNRVL